MKQEDNRMLRQLVERTGIPLKKLSEIMGVSCREILHWYNGNPLDLDNRSIENLELYFNRSYRDMLKGKYDAKILRRHIHGNLEFLPDRYQQNAFSYVRSSAHIVEFVSLLLGREYIDNLLLEMNVYPCYLDNLENNISLQFIVDLLEKLDERKIINNELRVYSRALFLTNEGTELGDNFKKQKTYRACYEMLSECTEKFDLNFDYKFHISNTGLELFAKSSELLMEATKGRYPKSKKLYLYKKFLLGSFPELSDLEPVDVEVKSCISQGDPYSHYRVEFPKASSLITRVY